MVPAAPTRPAETNFKFQKAKKAKSKKQKKNTGIIVLSYDIGKIYLKDERFKNRREKEQLS